MDFRELAARIDHTNLSPDAMIRDIERLCEEAKQYGFRAVVVNPIWVPHAVKRKGSAYPTTPAVTR
jgi:deoxyribose-phosphate aldolase